MLRTRILSFGGTGKKLDEVPRARGRLGARCRWGGQQTFFQLTLPITQRRLVDLNLVIVAANFSSPLSRHPAMLV